MRPLRCREGDFGTQQDLRETQLFAVPPGPHLRVYHLAPGEASNQAPPRVAPKEPMGHVLLNSHVPAAVDETLLSVGPSWTLFLGQLESNHCIWKANLGHRLRSKS